MRARDIETGNGEPLSVKEEELSPKVTSRLTGVKIEAN